MVLWRLSIGVTLLAIMNVITVLLCALTNQVASHTDDIFPARILAQQKTISENSDLYVTCSTFGSKKSTDVYVYLCKDDHGISRKVQKQDQNDITLTIPRVGLDNNGNYSCVYSIKAYKPSEVFKRGHNIIQIQVIDVSVAGPSTVSEGDDVDLKCTVSDTLQTLGGCQLIQSYLMRNESILQVQPFNVTQMEAVFTIKGAIMRDSGHYSCVVLPSKCIQEHKKTLHGNNTVLLKVEGDGELLTKHNSIWTDGSFSLRVIVSCGVLTLMLLLGVCLWCIKQGNSALCKPSEENQEADTSVMMEEQQEQTEQTEGEDLESQDGESFSVDEGEEEYAAVPAEDSTYSDDYEGVYSVADDPPASPLQSLYATSIKRGKTAHPVLN